MLTVSVTWSTRLGGWVAEVVGEDGTVAWASAHSYPRRSDAIRAAAAWVESNVGG